MQNKGIFLLLMFGHNINCEYQYFFSCYGTLVIMVQIKGISNSSSLATCVFSNGFNEDF